MADSKSDAASNLALRPQATWKIREEGSGQGRPNSIEVDAKASLPDTGGGGMENGLPLSPQWMMVGAKDSHRVANEAFGKDRWRDPGKNNLEGNNANWGRVNRVERDTTEPRRWGDDERDTGKVRVPNRWGREGEKDPETGGRRPHNDRWNNDAVKGNDPEIRPRPDRWGDGAKERDFAPRGFEGRMEERKEDRWGGGYRWGPTDDEKKAVRDAPRTKWVEPKDRTGEKSGTEAQNPDLDGPQKPRPGAWRPHARGRGEAPPQTGYRPHPYPVGRGKPEHLGPHVVGRGRGALPYAPTPSGIGALSEKQERWEGGLKQRKEHGVKAEQNFMDDEEFHYTREELVGYFEKMKEKGSLAPPPDFLQVPQLTLDNFTDPLALLPVSEEEEEILVAIKIGQITSSGVVHAAPKPREEENPNRAVPGVADTFDPEQDQDGGEAASKRENSRVPWRRKAETEKRLHETKPQDNTEVDDDGSNNVTGEQIEKEKIVYPKSAPRLTAAEAEKLTLLYTDPQGQIQGPFLGAEVIAWHEKGFFGLDLPVKLADASPETPFEPLGIVMPHLQKRDIVPPGFKVSKAPESSSSVLDHKQEHQDTTGKPTVEKPETEAQVPPERIAEIPASTEDPFLRNPATMLPLDNSFGMPSLMPFARAANLNPLPDIAINPLAFGSTTRAEPISSTLPAPNFPLGLQEASQKVPENHQQPSNVQGPFVNQGLRPDNSLPFGALPGQFDGGFRHPSMVYPQHVPQVMSQVLPQQGMPPSMGPVPHSQNTLIPPHHAPMIDYLLQSGVNPDLPVEEILRQEQRHQQLLHMRQIFPPQFPMPSLPPLGPAGHFMPQPTAEQQQNPQQMPQQQQGLGVSERVAGNWEMNQFGQFVPAKNPMTEGSTGLGASLAREGEVEAPAERSDGGAIDHPQVTREASQFESERVKHEQFESHNAFGSSFQSLSREGIWGGKNDAFSGMTGSQQHDVLEKSLPSAEERQADQRSFAFNTDFPHQVPPSLGPQQVGKEDIATPNWHTPAAPPVKSLKEIQEEEALQKKLEEQKTHQQETLVKPSSQISATPSPWKATVGSVKPLKQILAEEAEGVQALGPEITSKSSIFSAHQHTQEPRAVLRDVIAEEVLKKINDAEVEHHPGESQVEKNATEQRVPDEGEFIEAKEAKKNKKKTGKSKAVLQTPPPESPVLTEVAPKPAATKKVEKTPEAQLPAPSPATLSDFIMGGTGGSEQKPTAWSAAVSSATKKSGLSLKEIQEAERRAKEEQMKRQLALEQQHQSESQQSSAIASGPWARTLVAGRSNPIIAAAPKPTLASKLKHETVTEDDDDLFWDNPAPKKPSILGEKHDFPPVAAVSKAKQGTAQPKPTLSSLVKGPTATTPAASVAPSVRAGTKSTTSKATKTGPSQAPPKVSEAQAFKAWCESKIKKITGNSDMTLLEFCMSLPTAKEAGVYLDQYLGTTPEIQSFKVEFLSKKMALPEEVARLAFGVSEAVIRDDPPSANERPRAPEVKETIQQVPEQSNKPEVVAEPVKPAGSKKKGKKGKKMVDPSLLGFSTTTNRIMVGEIDHVEDA